MPLPRSAAMSVWCAAVPKLSTRVPDARASSSKTGVREARHAAASFIVSELLSWRRPRSERTISVKLDSDLAECGAA